MKARIEMRVEKQGLCCLQTGTIIMKSATVSVCLLSQPQQQHLNVYYMRQPASSEVLWSWQRRIVDSDLHGESFITMLSRLDRKNRTSQAFVLLSNVNRTMARCSLCGN